MRVASVLSCFVVFLVSYGSALPKLVQSYTLDRQNSIGNNHAGITFGLKIAKNLSQHNHNGDDCDDSILTYHRFS